MPAPQPGAVLSRENGSSAGIQIHPWRSLLLPCKAGVLEARNISALSDELAVSGHYRFASTASAEGTGAETPAFPRVRRRGTSCSYLVALQLAARLRPRSRPDRARRREEDDGFLVVNLWPSRQGSEAAARGPRQAKSALDA